MNQEFIALSIVALSFLWLAYRFFLSVLKEPLARWSLKRGKAGWAMRLHKMGTRRNKTRKCRCRSGKPSRRKISAS